jgi:hypothetical protein
VDDLSLAHRHLSLRTLLSELRAAAAWLIYSFETELGLPFSRGKAVTLASSTAILQAVKSALGRHAGTAEMSTRRLGADFTTQRPTKVMNTRLLKAKYRAGRQSKWAGNVKHAKLFHCGTIPSALFGMECVPIPPSQIRRLRGEGLRSHRLHSPGIAHDTAWMALAPSIDPAFLVAWGPIARWHREVWLNTASETSNMHGVLVTSTQLCTIWQNHKNAPATHHGRMAKNPITALITGLRALRWTLTRWDFITLQDGREVLLSMCRPAMLKQLATEAYTNTFVTKFEPPPGPLRPGARLLAHGH